jgi:hypothetical protein
MAPTMSAGISISTRTIGSQATVQARWSVSISTNGVSLRRSAAVVRGVALTGFVGPSLA